MTVHLRRVGSAALKPRHDNQAAIGSFKDAEIANAKRIAALTPSQRVKMVCSMDAIARRLAKSRGRPSAKGR